MAFYTDVEYLTFHLKFKSYFKYFVNDTLILGIKARQKYLD